jgi:hypothetical protein
MRHFSVKKGIIHSHRDLNSVNVCSLTTMISEVPVVAWMLLTLLIITGSGRMCLNSLWYHLVPSPVVILFEQHRFPSTSPEQICWRSSPDLERILRDLSRLFAMFGLLEQLQHDDPPVVSVASASRRTVWGAHPRCELIPLASFHRCHNLYKQSTSG